jgi:anthranilate phosphoribosyltransferase
MPPDPPHSLLADLLTGSPLSEARAEQVFESMLSGAFDDAQIAAILTLIQSRGVTVDELAGAARVMRRHVTRVPCPAADNAVVIDTCGTGGAPKTFNISTAVALVVAAASPHHNGRGVRVVVAKHGNRSRSGRGSAEVLQRLGVNVDAPPEVQARCLDEAGVCFCFAIHHHPATRFANPARQSLGFPTIFNLLGPLTNPAGAARQLIGTYSPAFVETLARTLSRLGSEHAIVVHGSDGMDEITTTGPSLIARVDGPAVTMSELDPSSLGIPPARPDHLTARDLGHAVEIIRAVLSGVPGPARDIVLLNAAAALLVAGVASDLSEGLALAGSAVDGGRAGATLEALARLSHGPAPRP